LDPDFLRAPQLADIAWYAANSVGRGGGWH
jgi:hypothetical protein